jgi:hypothetical protein
MLSKLQDFLDRNHVSDGHTLHRLSYSARQLAQAEYGAREKGR